MHYFFHLRPFHPPDGLAGEAIGQQIMLHLVKNREDEDLTLKFSKYAMSSFTAEEALSESLTDLGYGSLLRCTRVRRSRAT